MGALLKESDGKGKEKVVEAWIKGYCGDCEKSLVSVQGGRKGCCKLVM